MRYLGALTTSSSSALMLCCRAATGSGRGAMITTLPNRAIHLHSSAERACGRARCRVWSLATRDGPDSAGGHVTRMKMYGNWRSAAAFRVRVALNLKGIAYEETFLDLDAGEQFKPEFLAINPQGAVPAFFDGDGPPLTQSLAILDYLGAQPCEVGALKFTPHRISSHRVL